MPQAIVDPQELRRFAASLKHFNNEVQAQMAMVHGQLQGLAQTWRDREHDKFAEEFEEAMKFMSRFLDHSSQYIPFLMRKAERIEEYLQQR